jgi:ammonia channel protein AmtB
VFSGWEWWMAGQVTGGDRYPNTDSANELFLSLATETGNQLMIFKDFAGSSSFSFRAGLVALVILLYLLYRHFQKQPSLEQTEPGLRSSTLISSVAFHLLLMGLGYLVFMIPTRWYFYFAESFDLRLLGPGFGLIWLSFFTFLSSKTKKTPRLALWLFVCFSLFFALPKQPMFDAYQEKFWMRTGPVFPSR